MIKYIFSFLILFVWYPLQAQIFQGQVASKEDGSPISFAAIYVHETQAGSIANAKGRFELDVSGQSKITLEISSVGYASSLVHVDITNLEGNIFYLNKSHFQLDEVLVSVPGGKLNSENVVGVEQQRMKLLNLVSPPSLAASLSQLPGIDQLSTGSGIGKPVIRGLTGNRIVVYSQNIRLENQQFGSEHGLGENAVGVERVEVIKGPASLLYGADAIGGVVYLVDEKYASEERMEGFLTSGYGSNALSTKSSLGFKMNKNGLKWNLFSAYNSDVDYDTPDSDRVINTRFNEFSLKSALGYHRKNWVGNVRYSFLNTRVGIPEDALYSSSKARSMQSPFQHIQQHIVSLENRFYMGENEFSLVLGYNNNGRQEFEDHEGLEVGDQHSEEAALDMQLKTFTYHAKSIIELISHRVQLTAGVQGMWQKNQNRGEEILIPDAVIRDLGIYSIVSYGNSERIELQGGFRFDIRGIETDSYVTDAGTISALHQNFSGLNFSLGAVRKLNRFTARVNVATGFRPPNTSELLSDGVHHGALRYERGNSELNSERAIQTDLSLEYESEHLFVRISPFYNSINDYIYLQPIDELIDGIQVFEYEQSRAKLYGGEVSFHYHPHQIHWLHIESDFSSVSAKDADNNPLPLIPAQRVSSKLKAEFNTYGNFPFKNVFVNHVYKFAQNRVALGESSSESFSLVHIGLTVEMPLNNGKIDIQAGVNNLLNAKYIDHLSRLKSDGIFNSGRNFHVTLTWNWTTGIGGDE